MTKTLNHYINGKIVAGTAKRTGEVFNPATGEVAARVALANAENVDRAVAVGPAGDALVERLVPRVRALKVGPGTDPEAEMGPLVTKAHLERVESYIDIGVEEGAELVVGWPRAYLAGLRERVLHGRHVVRQRHLRDAHLQGGDVRRR